MVVAAMAGGCSSGGGGPSPVDQAFLSDVRSNAPDIGQFRSPTDLVRLGHVVCNDFAAHASYEQVADRLSVESGSSSLPTADLGAVIIAAADHYCPQYRGLVS
jgi:hypothetical protein